MSRPAAPRSAAPRVRISPGCGTASAPDSESDRDRETLHQAAALVDAAATSALSADTSVPALIVSRQEVGS